MIQTTNIRRILDRAMRHPMMRDIPLETAIEYAVDFISLMGTPALYEEKTALVRVKDWRGALPCDFVSMIQVRNATRQMGPHSRVLPGAVYRYSTHSFHMSKDKGFVIGDYTYKTQGMCIYTSARNTMLEIAYYAFAVDDEGYPLLPDNTSFLRGLENYIKVQWFTILFDMGKIQANVLQNAQREYYWAAGDAQSEFSRLDLDKAESLFNSFKMLLPRKHEHWRAFFTNGVKEEMEPGMFEGTRNAILDSSKVFTVVNDNAPSVTQVVSSTCEASAEKTSMSVTISANNYTYVGAFTLLDGEIFDSEITKDGSVITARWNNLTRGTVVLNALYKINNN